MEQSVCLQVVGDKRFCRFFCLLFSFFIGAGFLWLVLFPGEDFSDTENRMLASPPTISADAIMSGDYMQSLSSYVRDRIPFRTALLKIKSFSEYASLKRENNHVIAAQDGQLIKRFCYSPTQLDQLNKNFAAASALCQSLSLYGKPTVFLCAPRAMDVFTSFCPAFAEPYDAWALAEAYGAQEITSVLRQKADTGQYVWYKTDHHWTTLGAYYAYEAAGKLLGYTPFPQDAFYEQVVSTEFLGTTYSACLSFLAHPDKVTAMRYEGDNQFVVTDMSTGAIYQGFYREEASEGKDAYEYFLGRNTAHLRIEKMGEQNRPTLLIIKDSYAQCMVPFLARHYNIELIDLRYFRSDASETLLSVLSSPNYAGALLLFNLDTLSAPIGFEHVIFAQSSPPKPS